MERLAHVTNFVLTHPWAIESPYLDVISQIIARRIVGRDDPDAIHAAALKREQLPQPRRGGGLAVIPVHGVIVPRADLIFQSSGLTSLESLAGQIGEAVADTSVRTIVLDVNSPGGSIAGCTEFATKMLAWRQRKPIIAVANYQMASAAYWISAAATEIVAPPSAQVGSIGVFTIHDSLTKALAMEGVERTYIYAGKHKIDGHEAAPLSKPDQQSIQRVVDQAYAFFVGDVARGRSVSIADVRSGYGEGRVVFAEEAKALGMVDRVETIDETIARLTPSSVSLAAESSHVDLLAAQRASYRDLYRSFAVPH